MGTLTRVARSTPTERFLTHHRVQYFRCGQTKAQAFPNRDRSARDFAFLQLNPTDWLNFLVVDVDREDALMCLMHPAVPQPTWILENEDTGHAQAGWAIEPVYRGENAAAHPIRYAAAVQRSLDRLVDGDPCFTRYLVRNPAADRPAGRVWWGARDTPWSLGELKDHMAEWVDPNHDEDLDGPARSGWDPGTQFPLAGGIPSVPVTDTATEVGRNTALFRATRRWLWDQWRTHHRAPTDVAAFAHALGLNASLPAPLPEAEVKCLARSAVRQVNAGKGRPTSTSRSDAAHEYLSRVGRRGGQARTEAKAAAAKTNAAAARQARATKIEQLRAQAARLHASGATYQAIAEAVGRTVRTVTNWLKGTSVASVATDATETAKLQATGSSSPAARATPAPTPEVPPMTDPAYQWPAGVLPTADTLPDFTDRLRPVDRGLILWVPLDYLEDRPLGSGYWSATTARNYRATTAAGGPFHGQALGGAELHVTEVGARAAQSHGLRFPHLTAVSHEVARTEGDHRWSARFPAYVFH